jgi:hypothetical protein
MRSRSALLMITLSLNYRQRIFDSPYVTDRIRIATDGYVYAPTKLDWDIRSITTSSTN